MSNYFSPVISLIALIVSGITAFLTLMHRGKLRMTLPTMISFRYEEEKPKIFLRGLLYSTGKRGYIIEHMYVELHHGKNKRIFDFWMYGETNKLMIGSGLKVSQDGVAFNHHFVSDNAMEFIMEPGECEIKVYARVVSHSSPVLLSSVHLSLAAELVYKLKDKSVDALFTRQPDGGYRVEMLINPKAALASFDPEEHRGLLFPRNR